MTTTLSYTFSRPARDLPSFAAAPVRSASRRGKQLFLALVAAGSLGVGGWCFTSAAGAAQNRAQAAACATSSGALGLVGASGNSVSGCNAGSGGSGELGTKASGSQLNANPLNADVLSVTAPLPASRS